MPPRAPELVLIRRNGRERPVYDLHRGDVIAHREYDAARRAYIFTVVTAVPPSAEVEAEEAEI